jgi:hypothetical protein
MNTPRWAPKIRRLLAVLACVVLVDFVLRSEWVERPVARLIETAIGVATGERAVVGGVELSPESGRISVSGLVLSHIKPSGETSPIVAVERVDLRVGLPWDGAVVRTLEVIRPVFSLHVDDDGLREFRGMAASKGGELPWRWIRVENARIEVSSAAGTMLMDGIHLETTDRDLVDIQVETARLKVGALDEVARQVRLNEVRFSPGSLSVGDIRIESQHTHTQGSLDMAFGGALEGHATVSVALPMLDAFVSDVRSFEGTGHADFELMGTVREPVVKGTLLVSELVHHNLMRPDKPQRMDLERLVAQVVLEGRHLTIEEADLDWAEGQVSINGAVDLVSRGVALNLGLEGVGLRAAIREAGGHLNSWTDLSADGELHVGGTLSPFRLAGSFDLAAGDLDVASGVPGGPRTTQILGIPVVQLSGEVDTDAKGIWIRARRVAAGATSGSIDAFIGYSSTGPLDIEYDLDHASLATFRPLKNLDLWGFGRIRGSVKGEFKKVKFAAEGQVRDFQMIGLPLADKADVSFVCDDLRTLDFHHFDGVLGASNFQGSAEVEISANTTMDVSVDFDDARVGDLIAIGGRQLPWVDGRISGRLRMVGDPSAPDGEIDAHIRDAEIMGEAFPSGRLRGWLDSGVVMIDELGLGRWSGEENLLVRGSVTLDWLANLEVTGTGFKLERLNRLGRMKLPIAGDLALDAVLQGQLLSPDPEGRLALRNTVYAGHAVPDSTINFSTDERGIALKGSLVEGTLAFTGLIPEDKQDRFEVDAVLRDFPVHTLFPVGADGSNLSSLLSGDVRLNGEWDGSKPYVDMTGRGHSFSLDWDRHKLRSAEPWSFAITGRQMRLEGFHLQGAGTDFSLDLASDSAGRLSGLGGGVVDADLARMAVPGLHRADGPISLNVGVGGTINKAEWSIDAALRSVTVQGDWFPHPIETISGVVSFTADETRFRALEAQGADQGWLERDPLLVGSAPILSRFDGLKGGLGGGAVSVTGGWMANRWKPTDFTIAGTVTNGRVRYLEDFPAATGDAALTFDGPVGELLLAGRVNVAEMIFSDRISWEDSLFQPSVDGVVGLALDEEEPWFSMDIDLVADNTIRIRNNLADMVAGGSLKVVGDTKQPGMVGNVRCLPGGTVFLKEREFEVQRAELHFVDPFSYDPDVDLLLATDIRTRNEQYAVNYRVSGTYNDWRAETRSEPALPSADVNALLLFGMTRAELERYGGLGSALALEGGDLLASSVLFTGLDDPDRGGIFRIVDPLRPERLDLVSGVSERGSGVVTSELRLLYENELTDVGLAGTMLIFEQNISRSTDTYFGIEQRLARTLYARSYWGSEQVGRYMDLGGAYGLDVKIRWELD